MRTWLGALTAGLVFVGLVPACSSSGSTLPRSEGSGESIVGGPGGGNSGGGARTCLDACEKANECFQSSNDCASDCQTEPTGSCRNQSEIEAAVRQCNQLGCEQFAECVQSLPSCDEAETG